MFRKRSLNRSSDFLNPRRRRTFPVSAIPRKKARSEDGPLRHRWLAPSAVRGRGLKIFWLCCCLLVLGFSFVNAEMADHEVIFVWGMIALTFPAGLLVAAGFAVFIKATYQLFQMSVPSCFSFDLLMWPFFVLAGYLQWFVLSRWASRKHRPQE